MKLQEAIETALDYEAGVHKIYLEALNQTNNDSARRIFQRLCDEEKGHLHYLQSRLEEWRRSGKINVETLPTAIPAPEVIAKSLEDLKKTVQPQPTRLSVELELLKKAREAEIKTGEFYKEMVAQLDGEGRMLFKRFVEIEEGHLAIVQAEIDVAGNWGFWFDTPEFRFEDE